MLGSGSVLVCSTLIACAEEFSGFKREIETEEEEE
jgi:hypothetical protein